MRAMARRRPSAVPAALVAAAAGVALVAPGPTGAGAQVPVETPGRVETLALPPSPHWVWLADAILERGALVDLDSGALLGIVNGGYGPAFAAAFSADGRAFFVPETHYSRRTRGERTDVVTFYDTATLAPQGEVVIPPKRAINVLPLANLALEDGGRFLAVFNMTPATSLSIVDVQQRRFAGEIALPGCSLVYAAGERRFFALCADGAALVVTLDAEGREAGRTRTPPFFDPGADPVTEKAVRLGDTWLFVSFGGRVHPVDVSGEALRFPEPWSLLDEADREQRWRVGGQQHLAVHERSGRLYSLVHQGGEDTHKDPGSELWVYDTARRERIQRIELVSPGLTYMGSSLAFGQDWIWPFRGLYDGLLALLPEELGTTLVAVTPDADPRLVIGTGFSGSVAVYDALSGEFLHRVVSGNLTTQALRAPWGGP